MRYSLVLMLGVVQLYAADPRIGTWKEISFEENPITTLIITPASNGIHLVSGGKAGGVLEFSARFDGQDYPILHTVATNQISLRKVNPSTIEATFKRDGRPTGGVRRYQVFNDGKELVCRDTITGSADQYALVFDRKGGPKDPANPVVGAWTVNPHKTVQRNAELITFAPDGDHGVSFSGSAGFGYDAQLDGNDYPAEQSRNDSVSLNLIDARTVEETWKRGGNVTDSMRWAVSPDGQQLTMTAEGVQPDGSRYKSKEVYRKQ